jgi:hypothetical protein
VRDKVSACEESTVTSNVEAVLDLIIILTSLKDWAEIATLADRFEKSLYPEQL